MPKPTKFHGAPPLDTCRGFAPEPHANLRQLASLALLYLIVNTLAHTTYFEKRSQGLRNM